ncbi:MAG: glutathione S-transferase family protein [Sphingomonadaceae bacterium]
MANNLQGAVLYHGEPNGPSLSVLAALAESGLDIECRPIDLLAGERHTISGITQPLARDMSLEGEGPVLVIDGEAMSDSVFLAQFFDETVGGCGLQPENSFTHWEMMMWCRQLIERLAPAAALLGTMAHSQTRLASMDPEAFRTLSDAIVSEDLRARWQALHDNDIDSAQVADSKAKVDQFAARIEDQLTDGRDWLMREFSIADLETYAWINGMQELEPAAFGNKPRLKDWLTRMGARKSVQTALSQATSRATSRATQSDPQNAPQNSWAPGPEINRWG